MANTPSNGDFLDRPALRVGQTTLLNVASPPSPWMAGRLIGPFRLIRRLGAGGMGEVWLAERVDGEFNHIVALKLMLPGSDTVYARFLSERQILAELEHPGIARLYDGGLTEEGWPWMAMEYVRGQDLINWCQTHNANLQQRLKLFMQVCDAVAYAHAHLVVHRDIKPSNILVTEDGNIKLLDFGIAKLLSDDLGEDATRTVHLSPNYAAPEQLQGGVITTATDTFALGVTLYQLLTGRLPWRGDTKTLSGALRRMLDDATLAPSRVAHGPVPSRLLRGDLDAIVGKALRHDARARYLDARSLGDDIQRHLNSEPVRARSGARWYIIQRFMRRNWLPLSTAVAVFIALAAGLSMALSQQQRAQREAERATSIQRFLIDIFDTANPRLTQTGKAASELTARELLDASVDRIDSQFGADPETRLALLEAMRNIYHQYREDERYDHLQQEYVDLLRERHRDEPARWLKALLEDVDRLAERGEYALALQRLDELDAPIHDAGLDRSIIRADWWGARGVALRGNSTNEPEQIAAYQTALNLYTSIDPRNDQIFTTLVNLGVTHADAMDYADAQRYYEQALAFAPTARKVEEPDLGVLYYNLGTVAEYRGDFAGADDAYSRAEQIARRTYGETQPYYWDIAATRAATAHLGGDRQRALMLFDALLTKIPDDSVEFEAISARESHASSLVTDGRAAQAINMLEAVERAYESSVEVEFLLWRVRSTLGDAYDRVGRTADARRTLQAALDWRAEHNAADQQALLNTRERWGRFLLEQGDVAGAEAQFLEVLNQDHERKLSQTALAQADIARVALARNDVDAALGASTQAVERWQNINGWRNVRMGPMIWLTHSEALRRAGENAQALQWAQQALEASRRYDDPAARSISDAEAAVRAASQQ
ncbi:MAG: protein kinase [Nevskiaceae bacterium]|jgi:serine/threonine-protein kinase|nr:protein kinase [Nevskiaceae bacterium]